MPAPQKESAPCCSSMRLTLPAHSHTMPVVLRLSCRYFYKGALPTMKRFYFLLSFTTMFLLCANVAWAQQTAQNPAEKPSEKPKEEKKTPPAPEEKVVTSKHSLR